MSIPKLLFFILSLIFLTIFLGPFVATIVSWKSEIISAIIKGGMLAPISITAIQSSIAFAGYLSIKRILTD